MSAPSDKVKSLLSIPYSGYNVHNKHSIVLDHPLDVAFPVLAHGHQMERIVQISELCTDFELYNADTVIMPGATPTSKSRLRTEPPSGEGLSRQWFRLEETVKVLLKNTKTEIYGCQTWDDNNKVELYETATDTGMLIGKLRQLKEFEEDGKEEEDYRHRDA